MKLKDYIKKLEKLAKKFPNATVVYSSDDEGNSFDTVEQDPSPGVYGQGEFHSTTDDVDAICIN